MALPQPCLFGRRTVLVVNGDVLTDIDFQAAGLAAKRMQEHNLLAHLWLVDNPPHHPEGDFGLLSDGLVSASSADGQALTFSGVGVYHPALFKDTPAHRCQTCPPVASGHESKQNQRRTPQRPLVGRRHSRTPARSRPYCPKLVKQKGRIRYVPFNIKGRLKILFNSVFRRP